MNNITSSLMFDMRAPVFGTPAPALYAAALEMAAFGDEIGISRICVMEHHGSDDGYLTSPFVMAGGIAARTKRSRICIGAIILPLHNPVKIAEQIAVLDLMSGGRLEVILAAGYVPSEFAMFGRSLKDRGKLLDQGIEIILRALRGERFEVGGRKIFVRPLPIQAPEDILQAGGGVEASAKRAARFGIGFVPLRADLFPLYDAECRRLGRQPGKKSASSGGPMMIHLSEDPDKDWELLKPHALHVVRAYAEWADQEEHSNSPFKSLLNEEALRRSGLFAVWTPDELVARAPALVGEYGSLNFAPLIGGLAPEVGWKSLELLKHKVMPRLRNIQK